jgi:hypothetical protein
MSETYATGGTIPSLGPDDDRIPAILSACGYPPSPDDPPADDDPATA